MFKRCTTGRNVCVIFSLSLCALFGWIQTCNITDMTVIGDTGLPLFYLFSTLLGFASLTLYPPHIPLFEHQHRQHPSIVLFRRTWYPRITNFCCDTYSLKTYTHISECSGTWRTSTLHVEARGLQLKFRRNIFKNPDCGTARMWKACSIGVAQTMHIHEPAKLDDAQAS